MSNQKQLNLMSNIGKRLNTKYNDVNDAQKT